MIKHLIFFKFILSTYSNVKIIVHGQILILQVFIVFFKRYIKNYVVNLLKIYYIDNNSICSSLISVN